MCLSPAENHTDDFLRVPGEGTPARPPSCPRKAPECLLRVCRSFIAEMQLFVRQLGRSRCLLLLLDSLTVCARYCGAPRQMVALLQNPEGAWLHRWVKARLSAPSVPRPGPVSLSAPPCCCQRAIKLCWVCRDPGAGAWLQQEAGSSVLCPVCGATAVSPGSDRGLLRSYQEERRRAG